MKSACSFKCLLKIDGNEKQNQKSIKDSKKKMNNLLIYILECTFETNGVICFRYCCPEVY